MTTTHTITRLRPVIRVFVSSTFSDMRHERNALQEHVYPKLEQLCQKNGFQFQAIDLRWGVSTEAGLDHRAMRICFEELRRAQEISPRPNFLILLGNRYGWRPLPEEISVAEFQTLEGAASIMGEPARAVLRNWYRKDENAVPPFHILQSRRQDLNDGKDYTQDVVWNEVQAVLWAIINRAMPPEGLAERFDTARQPSDPPPSVVRFQASATEQEIWQGALRVPSSGEHVLAFLRDFTEIDARKDSYAIKDFVDVLPSGGLDAVLRDEQTRLKKHLRDRLISKNVFESKAVKLRPTRNDKAEPSADITTDHLAKLCTDVEDQFKEIIQDQIDAYWRGTRQASVERALRDLEIEKAEHARVSHERGGAETFVGREDKLAAIHDYLLSDSTSPLVIHGISGCGKTALLARAAKEASSLGGPGFTPTASGVEASPTDEEKVAIITRFIGVTPRSSDLRGLLTSLCQELRLRHPREGEMPMEIKLLEEELQEHFKAAAKAGKPLILFLDALDQLADIDGGRLLHWIPIGPLPAPVKLVVSCLSDRADKDPAGQPYAELMRRQLPDSQFINLDAFSEGEARTLLFERWLPQAGRTVSPDQRTRIEQHLASETCRQPIYLKLLFEEARLWRSYNATPALGEDVPALLKQLFDRLSQKTNHGPLLVERVLGYLAASREGLAENEILEILFRDPEYKKALDQATQDTRHEIPPNATRIPIAIWSRLRFDLASYLTERSAVGTNVLTFYHRQVAEWVQEHITEATAQSWQPHPLLADYFRDLADPEKNQSWKGESPRPYREVVYHMIRCERHVEASRLLADLMYLDARISLVGRVSDLFTDYEDLRFLEHNVLEDWQRFLLRHASRLNRYPTSLFSVACLEGTDQVAVAARQMVDAGSWPKPWISARRIYTVEEKQEGIRHDRTRSLDIIAESATTIGPTAAIAPEAGIALVGTGQTSLMVIDLLGRRENVLLPCPQRKPRHLSFSADESRLAITDNTGAVELFGFQVGDSGRGGGLLPMGGTTCHTPPFRAPPLAFHGHLAIVRTTADAELTILELGSIPPTVLRRIHCAPENASNPAAIVTLDAAVLVFDDRQAGTCISVYGTSELPLIGTLEVSSRFLVASSLHGNTFAVSYADSTLRVYHATPKIHCVAEITHAMHVAEFCRADKPGCLLFIDRHGQMFEWEWEEQTLPVAVQTTRRFVAPIGLARREDGTYVMLTREGGIHFRLVLGAAKPNAVQIVGVLDSPRDCYVLLSEKDVTTLTTTARDWSVPIGTDQVLSAILAYADRAGLLVITHPGSRGILLTPDTRVGTAIEIQREITSAKGDAQTGFWLADRASNILCLDPNGRFHAHGLKDYLPSQSWWSRIHVCGDVIVWCGRCVCSGEYATEDSYIILFFRIVPGQKSLTLVGQRTGIGRGAFLAGVSHLDAGRTIVLLWKQPTSVTVTTGTVADYIAHTETRTEIQGIEDRPLGLVAGSREHYAYIIGQSALYCVDARRWELQAVLPTSVPITDMSSLLREDGEVVLVLGQTEVLRCRCIMPQTTGGASENS